MMRLRLMIKLYQHECKDVNDYRFTAIFIRFQHVIQEKTVRINLHTESRPYLCHNLYRMYPIVENHHVESGVENG